ncbi:MAG TPA: type III secretion fhipep protein [Candidatus Binatia bacterium]
MSQSTLRPAEVCKALLATLEASEGRRRRRKRDQTPDGIGLTFKRELLEQAVKDDPEPEAFEEWLLNYSASHESAGGIFAMARAVFEEWRLAHSMGEFKSWLEQGAPSDDATEDSSFLSRDQQREFAKGRL